MRDGVYSSYDAFIQDVNRASSFILDLGQGSANVNGEVESETRINSKARAQIATIRDTLARVRERQEAAKEEVTTADKKNDLRTSNHNTQQSGQILNIT